MADSAYRRSGNNIKLIDAGDGTFYEGYKMANLPSQKTVGVTSVSSTVSSTSATRKYMLITNNTDSDIWLGLGTASIIANGIPLFKFGSAYEISAKNGNLFTGDVTAIVSGTVSKTIQVTEG